MTTSSPSTARSSCRSRCSAVSTACWSRPRPRCSTGPSSSRAGSRTSSRSCAAVSGEQFYNTSPLDFRRLLDDPASSPATCAPTSPGSRPGARDVIDKFDFDVQIARLDRANLLYLVISKFADIDLHPDAVSNLEMGYLYEELIRRFSELSNETAGEHFTPREVIRLMVNLLFAEDDDAAHRAGRRQDALRPGLRHRRHAVGRRGPPARAQPEARLEVFGQELNDETYAICRSDMMLKGQDASHIVCGNSLLRGRPPGQHLRLPARQSALRGRVEEGRGRHPHGGREAGFNGRFGAGLPRINDGSFLFLQHMISKMKPAEEGGSRLAIVFNGSPLFTGAAGSGESEIRRWIIENDWLEAVVASAGPVVLQHRHLDLLLDRHQPEAPERRGKVQLVDAREFWVKMRKSLGDKRKEISAEQIAEITRLYADFTEGEQVKIFPNEAFGFQRITVERPLRLRWEVTPETHHQLGRHEAVGEARATRTRRT